MKNKNLIYIILGLIGIVVIATALILAIDRNRPAENINVLLETNRGEIKIELFSEHRPITVGNFISLIEKNFYDGLIFHRVIDGFMIQGGCPYGTGFGGPGYTIQNELAGHNQNLRGTISMANAGPNTGGSQFLINLVDNNFLNDKHSVFGRVIEGMNVVDTITRTETGPGDRPIENIIIKDIKIIRRE
jgi:peptidylprolyl isomerase